LLDTSKMAHPVCYPPSSALGAEQAEAADENQEVVALVTPDSTIAVVARAGRDRLGNSGSVA